MKQRGVAGKLREVGPALLSARDELSVVRCPSWQLEEGDGDNGTCWRSRWPACGSTAVDRRAALGGSYGVRGGREGAVGNEVPTAVGAVTRWTSLPAEPRGPNEDKDASRRPP
jgi:hypothetical protein